MKVIFLIFFLLGLSMGNHSDGSQSEEEYKVVSRCVCGRINLKRIVGGKQAGDNEYPWMAAILHEESTELLCGGTIITYWHVLTSALCTYRKPANEIVVCVGISDINSCVSQGKIIRVSKIYNRDDFDSEKKINDISIILTMSTMKVSQNVGRACFPPTQNTELENDEYIHSLKLTGWGLTGNKQQDGDFVNTKLSEIEVEAVKWDNCRKIYPGLDEKKTQICSISAKGGACEGDGGDPLLWLNPENELYTVAALVSYGPQSCEANPDPTVNTKVMAFRSWIIEKVSEKTGVEVCSP